MIKDETTDDNQIIGKKNKKNKGLRALKRGGRLINMRKNRKAGIK